MSSKTRSVIVKGTGSYAPRKVLTNAELAKKVDTSDEWIRTRTGIRSRHIADDDEQASDMGAQAATKALEDAGLNPSDIDIILVATMTPDMPFPSTACLIQAKLGLHQAICMDIEAACSGFLYVAEVAASMLEGGRYRNALVIGTEKISSILDWEDRTTCVLFGDGAGAAVFSASSEEGQGFVDFRLGADGAKSDMLYMPGGGSAIPASEQSLSTRQHFLKMRGREVFKSAVRVMEQSALDILKENDLNANDIKCVIPHQANLRIIESLASRLELPLEKFYLNLDRYGNTSAASIPIALDEAYRSNRFQSGDLILMVAFGAGLTWGASILKWY